MIRLQLNPLLVYNFHFQKLSSNHRKYVSKMLANVATEGSKLVIKTLDQLGRLSAKILQESCKQRLSAKTQDCNGYLIRHLQESYQISVSIFFVKALKKPVISTPI